MPFRSTRRGSKRFFIFPLLAIAFVAAMSAALMFLWNLVLVEVMAVKSVSYIQSVGLFILGRILFGNFKGGNRSSFRGNPEWKEKIRNMSDEEREKFRVQWRERCRKR